VALQNKNGNQVFDLTTEVISQSSVKKGLRHLILPKYLKKRFEIIFWEG